jgi:hypothetical protein
MTLFYVFLLFLYNIKTIKETRAIYSCNPTTTLKKKVDKVYIYSNKLIMKILTI